MVETHKDEMWNWLCSHCGWQGVAQELHWNEREIEHSCPVCFQTDIRQMDWHKGNKKLNIIKRHI